ncbi:type II toxin-antitoxin system Phd/YefM family antitoxin [Corynebacterium sp.]|uniref:type II toxin-antitoxin system Phd/YefM family antitoxin n=1 Tax=Corynebacterium sp. TaxID=1720 RepID=UPI0026DEC20E|nr:type II toxin-antitoxin system prevent-host-death family antitoxin [Corynebacterium sp.]MDO5512775.1 type II toxin-antitoxin system prevent-host-death family antitoxin [Corynebacterium sp.]
MAIPVSEARRRFLRLITQVNDDDSVVEISSRRGDAVLMSRGGYESLLETVHLMRSPANARHLLDSLAEAKVRDSGPSDQG